MASTDDFAPLRPEIRASIRRNHPNPDRVSCAESAGSEKLARLACGQLLPPGDPVYRHLMECSPCYEELTTLTEQAEAARAQRRNRVLVVIAVLLILLAAILLLLRARR